MSEEKNDLMRPSPMDCGGKRSIRSPENAMGIMTNKGKKRKTAMTAIKQNNAHRVHNSM